MSAGRFNSIEEAIIFYRERLVGDTAKREVSVYGNDDSSMEVLSRKDTYAVFKTLDDPVSEEGKWAVNALRTIKTFSPDRERDNFYEDVVDSLSAVTLYTVARAETGGEVDAQQYGFHHSIATDVRERTVRISDIDSIQEKLRNHDEKLEFADEYLGELDRREKSLEGHLRQIEEDLENYRSREHEHYQDVIGNSEHWEIIYDDIKDLSQDIEGLSRRLRDLEEETAENKKSVNSLQSNTEVLESNVSNVSYSSGENNDEDTGFLSSIKNWIHRKRTGWKQTEIDDWVSENNK